MAEQRPERHRVYGRGLSPASQHSLLLQGGPFDEVQAAAFEQSPCWREAIAVRRWDDTGKSELASGRAFADYLPLLAGLIVR